MGSRLDRDGGPFGQRAIISRPFVAIGELVVPLSPLAHHSFTMACNNAWSNLRLLTACGKLSQADFVAPRTSFFPSIKATLNHILTVDWYYIDALERGLRGAEANTESNRFFEPEE